MATVKFTFEDKNIAPKVVENVEEGISILEVAEDNDVHLNHNCGGVCACSTCHVYIEKGEDDLEEIINLHYQSDRNKDLQSLNLDLGRSQKLPEIVLDKKLK